MKAARRASFPLAALVVLMGCGAANLSSNDDAAVPDGSSNSSNWPPRCVPGIRETDCDWAGMQPALAVAFIDSTNAALLGAPLAPELDRPCARAGEVSLRNDGDLPLLVSAVAVTGSPAFTVALDRCSNSDRTGDQLPCTVRLCFTSRVSGRHDADVAFATNGGDVHVSVSGEVRPPTPGLDATFGGTGVRLLGSGFDHTQFPVQGAIVLNDDRAVAVWAGAGGLRILSAEGTLSTLLADHPPTLNGFPLDTVWSARAGRPGQGTFVYLGASRMRSAAALIHLRDDGTPDPTFGDRGVLDVGSFIAGESGGIDVQPSGRVLAMGSDVRAFAPDGKEDSGFRTSVGYRGRHAIDDSGRLYLATTTGVIRLNAEGGIDPGFVFAASWPIVALAVDRDQHLLVTGVNGLFRLDDAGVGTMVPIARQPSMGPVARIAVDARGRILAASDRVYRYQSDGTFDTVVGFSSDTLIREVICPRTGGCTIAGMLFTSSPNPYQEDYVLRLAP